MSTNVYSLHPQGRQIADQQEGKLPVQSISMEDQTVQPSEKPPNSDSADNRLTIDKMFELVSNQRRRYLLYYLWENDGQGQIGALAEQIAAWENDISIQCVTSKQRKCVYTALQQFHLKRLEQYDVVSFDKRDGTIELGAAAEDIKQYLDAIEESTPVSDPYTGGERDRTQPLSLSLLAVTVASLGTVLSVVGTPLPLVGASLLLALALGGLSIKRAGLVGQ
jgi:hypothetical protein